MKAGGEIEVCRVSTMIETDPVGPGGQGRYLNAAVEIETSLEPRRLLRALQGIEAELGRDRRREQRGGSRTCDLDILLMGEVVLDTPELTIPHPRLAERWFALQPLAQIAPQARHPVLKKTAGELLAELETKR